MLGPLAIKRGGVLLDVGPPARRALLIRLLLANGEAVSVDQLCEDLLEDGPPATAASSVHAHVSRLRAELEPPHARTVQPALLITDTTGYALQVPPESRDAVRFEQQVRTARQLLHDGQARRAHAMIEGALSLWRGAALADSLSHPFALEMAARLEEARLSAQELRATALIQLGEFDAAAAVAERLVAGDATRESAWTLLMRAVHLAGQPAEALRRHEQVSNLLTEELGINPGPEVRNMQHAVRRHTTGVVAPSVRLRDVAGECPEEHLDDTEVPFVGRSKELARLENTLRATAQGAATTAVVCGEEGAGKTRLLAELASRAARAGFDVVRVLCRDTGGEPAQPSSIAQLVSQLQLEADTDTDAPGRIALPPAQEITRALAEAAAGRPVLCVIDDLHRSSVEFQHLLAELAVALDGCRVALVQSLRYGQTVGIGGCLSTLVRRSSEWISLRELTEDDVREVLRSGAGDGARGAGAAARACELHERTGGNPALFTALMRLPAAARTGLRAELPTSARALVQERLDRLPPSVRTVLEVAAVIGSRPDAELIARVCAISEEDVLDRLGTAVSGGALTYAEQSFDLPSQRFRFSAGLVYDTLLAGLTPTRRRMLHAQVADALSTVPGHRPTMPTRHHSEAGPPVSPERLADAAPGTGPDCLEKGLFTEAPRWFDVSEDAGLAQVSLVPRARASRADTPAGRARRLLPGPPVPGIVPAAPADARDRHTWKTDFR
ncbi:BREX system ATP-binding domain-containing protein [Streptomyces sp. NPDC050523]|uniref:BREX system ATP-binding domain-containing protein n=1 Tax=Streptomyces sp. NPDC050523 TaxID=3365622 RepID=UPI00379ED26F